MCLGNYTFSGRICPDTNLNSIIDDDFELVDNQCPYLDPTEIEFIKNPNFDIMHFNISSLKAKRDDLKLMLQQMKDKNFCLDLILVCETHLTDSKVKLCSLPGFNMFEKHRIRKRKGGVCIYVNKNLTYRTRKDLSIFKQGKFESCFVEIIRNSKSQKNILVGEIYRVPGTSETDFINEYENLIKLLNAEKKSIIIGTDQNLDYLKINEHRNTKKFLDINLDNNLLPTIIRPTRITHDTATLIDNIYLSQDIAYNHESAIINSHISDHLPCIVSLQKTIAKHNVEPKTILQRDLSKNKINLINEQLASFDWSQSQTLNINEGYDFIIQVIERTVNRISPLEPRKIKDSKLKDPWITPGI